MVISLSHSGILFSVENQTSQFHYYLQKNQFINYELAFNNYQDNNQEESGGEEEVYSFELDLIILLKVLTIYHSNIANNESNLGTLIMELDTDVKPYLILL